MKPKNFGKKLFLDKRTIANLNDKNMKDVLGGVTGPDTTCNDTRLVNTCDNCPSAYFTEYPEACICEYPGP